MKMSAEQSQANAVLNAEINRNKLLIKEVLTGLTITDADYSGSDLRIKLSNGRTFLVSAIENDTTGKPILMGGIS